MAGAVACGAQATSRDTGGRLGGVTRDKGNGLTKADPNVTPVFVMAEARRMNQAPVEPKYTSLIKLLYAECTYEQHT